MDRKLYRVRADGKYLAYSTIKGPIWLSGPELAAHWGGPAKPAEVVLELGKGEVEECDKFGEIGGRRWEP